MPASKKTRALLAYLTATARPQLREKLCELLWDGPDDPRAGLRWSLTKLRPIVDDRESTRLVADREHVELTACGAAIDVLAVRRAVPGGMPVGVAKAPTEALLEVAPLLRGELLEGLELPDCYRFDDWLRSEREAARRLHVAIFTTLVERQRASAPADALDHARAWARLVPLDEAVHIAVMQLLVELDRKDEALAHYRRCARLFERELGHGPSRELERLRMAIGTAQPRPAEPEPMPAAVPATPLVGRTAERAALASMLDQPRARVTLLLGDPGIGKTRLLDELESLARARGSTVLRGRGVEAELVRPYGAWLDAFAGSAIGGPDPFRVVGDKDADRNRLFEAITAWLVARGGSHVVILDDIQWLDEASAALLHYIARSPAASAIRIALGARPGELADNLAALRLVRGLTRESAVHQIGLSPLNAAETAELAAATAPGIDVARVVAESGGHPLFAVEIARALARGDSTWTSLGELLAERIELLEGTAREIVPWAAALGGAFSADTLAAVTGFPLAELGRAVGELERRALVHVVGSEWDFAHDLIRAAAYQRISAPHRTLLHVQIARALAALPDPDDARAGAVAHHAGLGGDSVLCARACLAAGLRCLRLFAHEEGSALAERGLAHVVKLTGEDRVRIRVELLIVASLADVHRTHFDRRRRDQIAHDLERAILDARAVGCLSVAARGFNELSHLNYESGDYASAANSSMAAAQAAAGSVEPDVQARAFAYSAQCLALMGRDLAEAELLAGKAAELATSVADIPELVFALALIRHHQGDLAAAITLLDRAIELANRDNLMWLLGYCWSRGALFELQRGQPRRALPYCEIVQQHRDRLGDAAELPFCAVIEAAAYLALGTDGDHATAITRGLVELRAADAPALLAAVLTCLAEYDVVAGRLDDATAHATEAQAVAERAEAFSELAVARAILARIAPVTGQAAISLDALELKRLDARARTALATARSAIDN